MSEQNVKYTAGPENGTSGQPSQRHTTKDMIELLAAAVNLLQEDFSKLHSILSPILRNEESTLRDGTTPPTSSELSSEIASILIQVGNIRDTVLSTIEQIDL